MAIMAVPYEYVRCSAVEEAGDCAVNLAREQLPHFGIFRIGLILPADARYAFGISYHKQGLRFCKCKQRCGRYQQCDPHQGHDRGHITTSHRFVSFSVPGP